MALSLLSTVSLPTALAVGLLAGLAATLVMDVPMRRLLNEGMTPPFVAAGAVTGRDTADAPRRVAMAIHYGSGLGAGVIYVTLVAVVSSLVSAGPSVASVPVLALVVAAVVQLPVMVAFFSYFVLPTFGTVARQRVAPIRRAWLRAAVVYVLAVAVFVPVGVSVLG